MLTGMKVSSLDNTPSAIQTLEWHVSVVPCFGMGGMPIKQQAQKKKDNKGSQKIELKVQIVSMLTWICLFCC